MTHILISADALAEFFNALTLSRSGNGIYMYSDKEDMGDEPGAVTALKGLAMNDDMTFFASYRVPVEFSDIEEIYLDPVSIGQIDSFAELIAANIAPETGDEEEDDDFYAAIKIEFDVQEDGNTMIRISPSSGDKDTDAKFGGFLTQDMEDGIVDNFPAHQISKIIKGEGLDEAPLFVDKTDVDENPISVPDGPVSVWDSGAKDPMQLALAKARSFKQPLAIEKFHASRIHGVRIGEDWFGAIAPVPLNKSDMSEDGIFADSESLNAEYDFSGLRDNDAVDLEEPTQFPDEEFEEDDVEEELDDGEPEEDADEVESDEIEGQEELDFDEDESESLGFDSDEDDLTDEDEVQALVEEELAGDDEE